ncbi:MAG TPA: ATP-binding cassette domain-containing protein [Candidatus Acidoferrales bacterium]|nr:ATP-binding cassette domain-containing protein [Candidatus Acidoferrales bacterium]
MLEARIRKARAQFTVDVTIRVNGGEACGLFGASGAGKSTILACIAGAERPDGGSVALDGLTLYPPPLPLHQRPIGYLTQEANLFPHLRVRENVCFGLRNGARGAGGDWIAQLRERLQLGSIWDAPAHAISGGQARRVALARMLARKPKLVLLDEPFAGLDRNLVRELLAAIAQWQRELGFAMLVVDHEAPILERISTRAIVVEHGTVVQDDTWYALHAAPATPLLVQLLSPL